jgi:mannose-6-phosphate isomerase-like protein (cupin superfamily)
MLGVNSVERILMFLKNIKNGRHFINNNVDSYVLVDIAVDSRNMHICSTILKNAEVLCRHCHELNDQVYIILSGMGEIELGTYKGIVTEGTVLWIPPGEYHQISNVGKRDLEYVWVSNSISKYYPFNGRMHNSYYKTGYRCGNFVVEKGLVRYKILSKMNSSKWINVNTVVLNHDDMKPRFECAFMDSAFLVTSGKGVVTVDKENSHIDKHDLVLVRKGQKYHIENCTDDDLEYLEITCKAGKNILSDGLEYFSRWF